MRFFKIVMGIRWMLFANVLFYDSVHFWTIDRILFNIHTCKIGLICGLVIPPTTNKGLRWVYCFHVVHPSVCPSVKFCFLNILKSHCWIFIKPCKNFHICKTNTLDKMYGIGAYSIRVISLCSSKWLFI